LGLEFRDLDTKGHTDRVTLLALQLGQKLNLSARELSSLPIGSYLHDIGKIAIPDTILLKPGPLTESEKEVMHSHVQYGENMLLQMGFFEPEVRELVRHHHERWNGSGYPDSRAGEHIPLSARIFALADVYPW
jgi:putative nucleotidyltransferase with HDIG domain